MLVWLTASFIFAIIAGTFIVGGISRLVAKLAEALLSILPMLYVMVLALKAMRSVKPLKALRAFKPSI
jgi:hypothetical protein